MKIHYLLCALFLAIGCSDEEQKAIQTVLEEVDRGAVLRTLEIRNGEFDINDLNSEFSILLEEQDLEDGDLLESVNIQLSFIDKSPENGDQSVNSFNFQNFSPSDFSEGPDGLPRMDLIYSFEELLTATNLLLEEVRCKDQFRIDLELLLSNGQSFTTLESAGTVVNNSGFFKSPFTYLINIVEPIVEESFLGIYFMETIQEGGNGNPFNLESGLVELVQGHSNNVRVFRLVDGLAAIFDTEISIVCDVVIVTRYQKTTLPTCNTELDASDRVLLGPDSPPGEVDPLDDSVFELYILEGFEGYSAKCGYSNIPSKYRFSKQ